MTREQLILQIQQEYAERRDHNLRLYEDRVDAACASCEGLRELLDARHVTMMQGLRNALYPAKRVDAANAEIPATFEDYSKRIALRLAAAGLPANALAPVYTCPVCKDEGYVYEPTRHMCHCFENELHKRMLDELGLQKTQTFENFRDDLFSDGEPVSQRSLMRRNRDICLRYADSYPHTEVQDLVFTGPSGLGKTFLLQAIAHRVTERGFSVQYVSAYKLLETMRKAYFENNSELMRPLMEAPLLLVDDLGTEPLMENITVTQLFNLLNERQNAGRHTVISSNLNLLELKARYTERITSRWLDARQCRMVKFVGEDIRTKLGKASGGEA